MINEPSIYFNTMRKLLTVMAIILSIPLPTKAQTVFELEAGQSMLMTGKGPGQDATNNPLQGEDCLAVIKNTGDESFSIRIQQKGAILEIIPVPPKKTTKIKLFVGQELYLDSENKTRASVTYEKLPAP